MRCSVASAFFKALILTGVALPATAGELVMVAGIPLDFIVVLERE